MNGNYDTLLALVASGVVGSLLGYLVGKKSSKKIIKTFIDSQSNMIALYKSNRIGMINKEGLSLLGYDSFESFLESHADMSDLFMVDSECIDKYTYGIKWVQMAYEDKKNKRNTVKVKIKTADGIKRYFHVKVSKMHKSKYILTFSDITTIELEKTNILQKSELDPLTQIYNRVKLNEMFTTIFMNSNKYNQTLTMIMFDIDHFKMINDNFGHNVGDTVLKELAGLIRGMLREKDVFARWGGEEFIIVPHLTSLENSTLLAKRLCSAIEGYPFDTIGQVTCSFGVTQFTQADTQETLFERVDSALYEAKENGRNQVIIRK